MKLSALIVAVSLVILATTPSFSATRRAPVKVSNVVIEQKDYIVSEIEILEKPGKILAILTDYGKAADFFENLEECKVVSGKGETKLIRQVVSPSLLPYSLSYLVKSVKKENRIEFESIEGRIQKFKGFWKLEPAKNKNSTTVTYAVNIQATSYVPTFILRNSFRGHSPKMMRYLKKRIEEMSNASGTN